MKHSKFNDIFNTFLLNEMEANDTAPNWDLNKPNKTDDDSSEADETIKKAAEAGFKAIEHIKEKERKQEIIEGAMNAVESGESGDGDVVKLLEAIKQALGDKPEQPAQVQKELEQSGDGTDKTEGDTTTP